MTQAKLSDDAVVEVPERFQCELAPVTFYYEETYGGTRYAVLKYRTGWTSIVNLDTDRCCYADIFERLKIKYDRRHRVRGKFVGKITNDIASLLIHHYGRKE